VNFVVINKKKSFFSSFIHPFKALMKQVYSVDLINSFFSKEEATELILGLMNYKIDLHSNKLFATQVKFGIEDEESKYRLDRLTVSRDQLKAYLNETEETHFKLTAEIKIEPRSKGHS
jgi:hypothetical protein